MYTISTAMLRTSIFCLGMMSSAITLANTTESASQESQQHGGQENIQAQQAQGAQTYTFGTYEDQEGYEEETSTTNNRNILNEFTEILDQKREAQGYVSAVSVTDKGTTSDSTPHDSEETGASSGTYPTFTEEELAAASDDSMPGATIELEEGDDVSATDSGLEYSTETALLYQHLPVDPVYTYGKEGGAGACVGTEDFCAESELMWENFESLEGEELLVSMDADNQGQPIMPKQYQDNPAQQPHLEKKPKNSNDDLSSAGYTHYPEGNQYKSGAHFGKLEGNKYYVEHAQ